MQIKVFNEDAQVAFKIRIVLHQFSHKVNQRNCSWFYMNQLLKLFGQETKFSAEKREAETLPSLYSVDQQRPWFTVTRHCAAHDGETQSLSRLRQWHCRHGSCPQFSLVQKMKATKSVYMFIIFKSSNTSLLYTVSDFLVLFIKAGIQTP